MAEYEHPATDDELDVVDVVMVRETQRRRSVLRGVGASDRLVAMPDGGHRSGRKALRDALRPWQFVTGDEDDDHAA